MFQCLDIEAERGELVGNVLEGGCARLFARAREPGDTRAQRADQGARILVSDERERAFDLLEWRRKLREGRTLGLIAEEVVETLFDMRQVGEDLARHLVERLTLFPASRRFDRGGLLRGRQCLTTREGGEACQCVADLGGEARVRQAFAERRFDQQLRRGDLDRDDVVETQRVLAQPLGEAGQPVEQAAQHRAAQTGRFAAQVRQMFLEHWQGRGLARAEGVPCLLDGRELAAQRLQQW